MLQQRSFDSNLESIKFEPTVTTENEELLQDAIAAHQGGDLNEAEQLYRAILGIQPSHPDASHNLGVLNLSLNKVELALPLFHTALRVNQASEQYWLSYIDALIKLNRLDEARAAVAAAKTHKVSGSRLDAKAATLAKLQPQPEPADFRLGGVAVGQQGSR